MTNWASESSLLDVLKGKEQLQNELITKNGMWQRNYLKTSSDTVSLTADNGPLFWVTPKNELFDFIQHYNRLKRPDTPLWLRMQEVLGLKFETKESERKNFVVEMWVKPEDLFRPCFDPTITTTGCSLPPEPYRDWTPEQFISLKNQVGITPYLKWYAKTKETVFDGWPFTGLGYTYDWGNREDHSNLNRASHQGSSEYIVKENKQVYLHRIVPGYLYTKEKEEAGEKENTNNLEVVEKIPRPEDSNAS